MDLLTDVVWDTTPTRRTPRHKASVRIVSYNSGSTVNAVFSKAAIATILGHAHSGHIKIGLKGVHLVIIACSAEDIGARSIEQRPGKTCKRVVAADGVGEQLGVKGDLIYEGEVFMEDRDTYRAELQKGQKSKKSVMM